MQFGGEPLRQVSVRIAIKKTKVRRTWRLEDESPDSSFAAL